MSSPGLTGKQISSIILTSFEDLRWYDREQTISIVERSGLLTSDDSRVIGSGEIQFHRRTSNALRDLCKQGKLEKNEVRKSYWQYRKSI